MEGSTHLDHVYVINLDDNIKDWHRIHNLLHKTYRIERIPGVQGDQLNAEQQAIINPHYKMYLTRSIIGCALAHVRCWQKVVDDSSQTVLILEDDAIFSADFDQVLQKSLDHLPTDWDLLYLGCFGLCKPKDQYDFTDRLQSNWLRDEFSIEGKTHGPSTLSSYSRLGVPEAPLGAYAYVISNAGARKLLNFIQEDGILNHIDIQINHYRDRLNIYYVYPSIVQQDYSSSAIAPKSPKILNHLVQTFKTSDGIPVSWKLSHQVYKLQGWMIILGFSIVLFGLPFYVFSLLVYINKDEEPPWMFILCYFTSCLFIHKILVRRIYGFARRKLF